VFFSNRNSRRSLLIEVNPYQVLAAAIDRSGGPVVIEAAREFDAHDDAGLRQWLDETFDRQKNWLPAIAGFVPPDALLQRDSVQGRRLNEPDYLSNLVRDQYRIENPARWRFEPVNPLEGQPVPAEGLQRPALISGVSHGDVHRVQQRLLDLRLLPSRLELSLLPLFGAITLHQAGKSDNRAAVVVVIEQEHSAAFILGKEGVLTPGPVRHGFSSIVQAVCKEYGCRTATEVRDLLERPDDELLLRAAKFVRVIGRDLKPIIDSYEMTTGQPVGEIYCPYLPPALGWLAEPLSQLVGRTPFALDCAVWLPTVNIQTAGEVPPFGRHWLGALSLVADLSGAKASAAPAGTAPQGPWHIDYRRSGDLPSGELVRSRFITNTIALTLAAATFVLGLWQLYSGRETQADIAYWEQRMTENKRAYDAFERDTKALSAAASRLDQAYTQAAGSGSLADTLIGLGHARPPAIRLDGIESIEGGVVLRGSLQGSSPFARQTLNDFMAALKREPALAPVTVNVALTSFTRREREAAEGFDFEITLKSAKETTP
jgi:hypothetical protein